MDGEKTKCVNGGGFTNCVMAFQVGVNPLGGICQDDKIVGSQGSLVSCSRNVGTSIYATYYPQGYRAFLIVNTTGFIASLLLMSGLPIRRRLFIWIRMIKIHLNVSGVSYCII